MQRATTALIGGLILGSLVAGGIAALVAGQLERTRAEETEKQLRKRISTAEDRLLALQEDLANASQMAELWENEAKKLRNRLLDHVPQSELQALREQLVGERDALATKLDAMSEQARQLQTTLDATITEWQQKLTASEAAAQQRLDDLRTGFEARLATASENLAKASAERESAQAEVGKLGARLQATEGELKDAAAALATAQDRAKELAGQVEELGGRIAALEQEAKRLRTELDSANQARKAAEQAQATAEAALEADSAAAPPGPDTADETVATDAGEPIEAPAPAAP